MAASIVAFPRHWNDPPFIWKDFDLIGYRDYLLHQWISAVTRIGVIQPTGPNFHSLDEASAMLRLKNRFHQDFTVENTRSSSANEILIPILQHIMTSPVGGRYGFAFSPPAIPNRGSESAREYLDAIINVIGISSRELSLRYRTHFTRPESFEAVLFGRTFALSRAFSGTAFKAFRIHIPRRRMSLDRLSSRTC